MSAIHRVVVGDGERDPLLWVALGARACIARLDAILARHAPPAEAGDGRDAAVPDAAAPPTDGVALVLGVLAIRARIVHELEATAATAEPAHAMAAIRPGWLR